MSSLSPLHVVLREPTGGKNEPGVLLIHGFTSSGEADFGSLADRLVEAGRTCALVDLPGHGGSAVPERSTDAGIGEVLDALVEAADVLGDGPIDVVGYSLGARLAWELAARRPDRVRRLVLGGFGPGDPFSMLDFEELWALIEDGTAPESPVTAVMGGMAAAQGDRAVGIARLMEGLGSDVFTPSPEYSPSGPVLLLCGREDDLTQGIEQIAGMLAHVELVLVPGDHVGALRSVELADHTARFLSA